MQMVRCRECGYTTQRFNGWAFCGPCRTPGQPGYLHDFEIAEDEPDPLDPDVLLPPSLAGDDVDDE